MGRLLGQHVREHNTMSTITVDDLQDDNARFVPSLEQIRQACRELQATWSPDEHERRQVFRPAVVETHVVREMAPAG